ncbi:MAG TPA: response regulator, partial [Longimicrobiales bacterium]|nr:response regulator [Longimicrobiales bacterium]
MTKPTPRPLRVLLVDDERASRSALALCVEGLGHEPQAVSTAGEAYDALDAQLFDLALVDLRLGPDSGLDVVAGLIAENPWLKVAVI